ncbi:MAG TPA: glucose-6-phosphate dehydrogenase assembly protein OpcA [Gemmataceae bacterium]|nr:glucose-6-phosphate dehydrogenase assembly protein OpcA [Gemmataceae bacterium]
MTTTAAPSPGQEAITVPLGEIERELNRQLRALQGSDEAPLLRARMSNLVIFCDRKETSESVTAQIPDIVAVHPARVVLLVAEPGPEDANITATVQVRGHRLGNRQQACTEQVTLYAAGAMVGGFPFAVRALEIGDLPTNLWWASAQPPPLAGPLLYGLSENAQQIIYDSLGWLEPARAVAATANWIEQLASESGGGRWRVASDLNWRRLKYWRRLLAQALDPASAPAAAESVSEVLVEHGPHAVVQAWELMSWLSQMLNWQVLTGRVQPGVELSWRFASPKGEPRIRIRRLEKGPPEIRRVQIACRLEGKPVTMNLVVESDHRLAGHLEGIDAAPRTVNLPKQSPAELIGRQLSDREPDPVFRESMSIARVFARSVLS